MGCQVEMKNERYVTKPSWVPCQSLPTLCDTVDCSPQGSSVRGILQARILEQVAISSSRGSSRPRDPTHIPCDGRWLLYHWYYLGSPEMRPL